MNRYSFVLPFLTGKAADYVNLFAICIFLVNDIRSFSTQSSHSFSEDMVFHCVLITLPLRNHLIIIPVCHFYVTMNNHLHMSFHTWFHHAFAYMLYFQINWWNGFIGVFLMFLIINKVSFLSYFKSQLYLFLWEWSVNLLCSQFAMCLDCDFFFHSEMFDFYGIEFINVSLSWFWILCDIRKDSPFQCYKRVHLQSIHLKLLMGLFTKCLEVFIKIKSWKKRKTFSNIKMDIF